MIDLFYPARPAVKGARRVIRSEGKSDRSEYHAEYYRANKERIRARQHEYYEKNKAKIIKAVAKYQKEHIEQKRAWKRALQRGNRDAERGMPVSGQEHDTTQSGALVGGEGCGEA